MRSLLPANSVNMAGNPQTTKLFGQESLDGYEGHTWWQLSKSQHHAHWQSVYPKSNFKHLFFILAKKAKQHLWTEPLTPLPHHHQTPLPHTKHQPGGGAGDNLFPLTLLPTKVPTTTVSILATGSFMIIVMCAFWGRSCQVSSFPAR